MPVFANEPASQEGMYFSNCPHHMLHVVREIGEKFPDHAYPECQPLMWFHSDEIDEQPPDRNQHTKQQIQVATTMVFDRSDFPEIW